MWGLQTGAVWKAAAGVGAALAGRVAESASGREGIPVSGGLACADFDTGSMKQLKQFDLVGKSHRTRASTAPPLLGTCKPC